MSVVTDVILTFSVLDEATDFQSRLTAVTQKFDYNIRPLVQVDQHASATGKAMQGQVFIGAYNYLDEDAFIAAIESVDWEYPEVVCLFLQREHDEQGFSKVLLRLPGERRRT